MWMHGTRSVLFTTGLSSKSLEQKVNQLTGKVLDAAIILQSNRTPSCLPLSYGDHEAGQMVFAGDEFVLEGSVSYQASIFLYIWAFSDGTRLTTRSSDSKSRVILGDVTNLISKRRHIHA
ncbi:uncharacterized protein CDAR_85051 [Caerostris darwini]|uniref:Uncharacterized protein n=1 Tax=Caerostris darwini TaxID=1538125 RepID=A0AAV4MZF1_9ARAC|nr:uncharacterized protein CDAR_85051 [Caerostris darwini]